MTNNEHIGSEDQVPVIKEESAEAAATMEAAEKKPTSVGLEENIAAALCHFPLIGLIFFFIEKENKVVRFHALQVIMLSVVLIVASIAVGILTGLLSFMKLGMLGLLISGPYYFLIMPASTVLLIFMAIWAYKGKVLNLPVIGKFAEEHSTPKQ
ncbi:hypothetical protein JSQ81_14705 [Sporosarcina sp. Marseille-Q4063]|uniref:DUF4870 domain-containing protein n=1 Tax=Sporosarcina sp. Marseille-Q4063 TaxID=2810514 RepID=UPI001BB04857|nr:hypothetical protein [Sporosarcina sp. Marseille-Q4063]QUW21053.1 hypothetical protein JSQ81_14705 [Sporosarcina sp. Marseille-Q4063]